ncbi:MAG: NAD-dependent epimerase/dehydratase family protein [Bacteroidales bacterium]|nr:NAD-dependent epimerase/dehydratase family protein [Bacteroidales bacterium]
MKERLFLIGGSGFIGKNLVRCLHGKYTISVYDKFIDEAYFAGYPDVKTSSIELDKDRIPADTDTPDFIVNLASIVTADRNLSLFDCMIASNLKVLLYLYERFKKESKLKLFIQFGSSEEYGNEGSPFQETMREEPGSPYALVKQLTTNTAMMLNRNYGFPIAVVRPGNLFGPLQEKSKFIPYVIESLRNDDSLNVTPCEQKRDFIYADDFAWAIDQLLEHSPKAVGEIINVSSGESISLKAIIEHCKEVIGSTSTVNYGAIPYRENEMMDLRCSVAKLEAIIGHPIRFNMLNRLNELI